MSTATLELIKIVDDRGLAFFSIRSVVQVVIYQEVKKTQKEMTKTFVQRETLELHLNARALQPMALNMPHSALPWELRQTERWRVRMLLQIILIATDDLHVASDHPGFGPNLVHSLARIPSDIESCRMTHSLHPVSMDSSGRWGS